jgi:signal transduction histidine kinase
MPLKCFMCGTNISSGILCEKCDKPRRPKSEAARTQPAVPAVSAAPPQPPQPAPAPRPTPAPAPAVSPRSNAAPAVELDPFPKAPVVPFPAESASPGLTSIVNLMIASGIASVLLGADRSVKFVSDQAKRLFDAPQGELLKWFEQHLGLRVTDLTSPASTGVRISNRNYLYSLVPLAGGASGAVLVFRPADATYEAHASFATYVRETVFGPLRALRDSLLAAARTRANDPFLGDASSAVEQILSSLEMAPEVEEPAPGMRQPTVTEVVRRVAERFVPFADLKNVQLQVDAQELEERFVDHDQLADSLAILMDNALHYVPAGGQVVIGVRWMEHKGKPLLLFFVMDNGPLVPEHLRQSIFEPDFVWQPASAERTGRSLFRAREFAVAHAGSVWVESKTGKACTFFLRVRPDNTR